MGIFFAMVFNLSLLQLPTAFLEPLGHSPDHLVHVYESVLINPEEPLGIVATRLRLDILASLNAPLLIEGQMQDSTSGRIIFWMRYCLGFIFVLPRSINEVIDMS